MASAFTGQPVSGTATAIAIAMIAYSAAIVSNARMVERRVKRDIFVPPSVNELALRHGNRDGIQTRKSKPIRRQGPTSYEPPSGHDPRSCRPSAPGGAEGPERRKGYFCTC